MAGGLSLTAYYEIAHRLAVRQGYAYLADDFAPFIFTRVYEFTPSGLRRELKAFAESRVKKEKPPKPPPKYKKWVLAHGYADTDAKALEKLRTIARRWALKNGFGDAADDFAQEAVIAYSRKGWCNFETAKKGYYSKFDKKWARIDLDEKIESRGSGARDEEE